MSPAYLFSADSIGKSFGARTILSSASVWAQEGRITALFGRNGCGKSTLLRIAAGTLVPDHGVVLFEGRPYLRPRLRHLAENGLFYLPQRDLLSSRLTLAEQLRAVEWRFGSGKQGEVVERLGLERVVGQCCRELSGGERRRAELAVALIRKPRLLLADEPFAGINPTDAEVIAATLRELAREGCGIIVSGHEVPTLMSIADEVVWMVGGTTSGLGSPASARTHHQFRREYLGLQSSKVPSR